MNNLELLKTLNLSEFVAFDFETTGLSPDQASITEAAAVRFVDGLPVEEYQQLVDPQRPIPREIVELTNITDDMVKGQPTVEEMGAEFLSFIGDSPLVGQNIDFDLGFLNKIYDLVGETPPLERRTFDTLSLARTFLYHHNGFSLSAICSFYDIRHDGAHRALADASNTGKVFVNLVAEAASYPMPIIQTINSIVSHVEIHNKSLYTVMLNAMSSTGNIRGFTESTILKPSPIAIFQQEGKGDDYGPLSSESFFGKAGRLSQKWDQYEPRPVQEEFASSVQDCFEDGNILLAEAGTGLGKSIAYLLPALNHAYLHRQAVVVSCHTKHLQDQLFYVEVPRIADILDVPIKAVILKGRGNYLCRTRLEYVLANAERLLGPDDCEKILPLIIWEQFTKTGDIDECPGFTSKWSYKLWRMLGSERGFCLGNSCNRFNGCYLGPIRRAVKTATLIVVNHALLIADSSDDSGLLPDEFALIIDEAHNLPRVTRDALTVEFSSNVVKDLADNYQSSRYRKIFRKNLKEALSMAEDDSGLYKRLREAAKEAQTATDELMGTYVSERGYDDTTEWRYSSQVGRYVQPRAEFRGLEHLVTLCEDALHKFSQVMAEAGKLLGDSDIGVSDTVINDLQKDLSDCVTLEASFNRIAVAEPGWQDVLWRDIRRDKRATRASFRCAPMLVGQYLSDRVFTRRPGTVMCSATLQINGSFDYYRNEVGLNEDFLTWDVNEKVYSSPFIYEEQCVALNWDTTIDVNDKDYPAALADLIDDLTDRLERRLLVLFTSYAQLKAVHEALYPRLFRTSRLLITQYARSSRRGLLEAFRKNERAILMGTSSFWEGIDLPGDLLEMVIMTRLPFANPRDPIVEARIEYTKNQGGNSFMEFQIPDAVTRFRQGFGRLIRTSSDEGIFIIADSRVSRKRYGEYFLDALPVVTESFRYADRVAEVAQRIIFKGKRD